MVVNRGVRVEQAHRMRANDLVVRRERRSVDVSFANNIFFKLALYAVLMVGLVVGTRADIANQTLEVVRVQQQVKTLNQVNENLRLDVAELKSPSRIQTLAEGQLGMVLPKTFVYSSSHASVVQKSVDNTEKIRD